MYTEGTDYAGGSIWAKDGQEYIITDYRLVNSGDWIVTKLSEPKVVPGAKEVNVMHVTSNFVQSNSDDGFRYILRPASMGKDNTQYHVSVQRAEGFVFESLEDKWGNSPEEVAKEVASNYRHSYRHVLVRPKGDKNNQWLFKVVSEPRVELI